MKEFSFSTRIFFGSGALERLREVVGKRVLIVTDRFMVESGVADKVAGYLTDCEVTIFPDVLPNPPVEVVAAGVECLNRCCAEVMVAVGGGSAIDAAKAIRALAGQISPINTGIMECFAVPTTSGTGSEVTEYAVITDTAKGIKYPLVSRALRPPVAILDPELVVSAPPSVTADSGMDVLTHALEAYVSVNASDFSDALAEKAATLVFRFLPVAYKNGNDLEAREKMHNAACLAGLAFNSAGLGLCHGIAHSVGGKLHLPHGKANAIALPHVVYYNADLNSRQGAAHTTAAKKYTRIAKLLGLPSSSVTVGVSQLVRALEQMNKSLQLPRSLQAAHCDMALLRAEMPDIVQNALNDATVGTNPRTPSEREVTQLINQFAG